MELLKKIKSSSQRKERRKAYRNSFSNKFVIEPYYSTDYKLPSKIDLITVSFNAPRLILPQIKLVKKFVKGNFRLIICDNSTEENFAKEIREICKKEDITYIRIEDRSTPNGYSNSHAIALNWIWENVVKQRKNNFAFLDHDIYPIKEIDIESYLKNEPIFGRYYFRPAKAWYMFPKNIWYLWPGFSFFNWECVKNLPLNFHRYRAFGFIKRYEADTGSGNWDCLYSKLKPSNLNPCSDEGGFFGEPEENIWVDYLSDASWLHILDGADRYNTNGNKVKRTLELLEELM